jgi:hypothetical protein
MYADMICDVMPPIPEDSSGNGINHEGIGSDNGEEAEANIEQLMVSMLEERDKVKYYKKNFFFLKILFFYIVTRKIT